MAPVQLDCDPGVLKSFSEILHGRYTLPTDTTGHPFLPRATGESDIIGLPGRFDLGVGHACGDLTESGPAARTRADPSVAEVADPSPRIATGMAGSSVDCVIYGLRHTRTLAGHSPRTLSRRLPISACAALLSLHRTPLRSMVAGCRRRAFCSAACLMQCMSQGARC